jgi:lysozyme
MDYSRGGLHLTEGFESCRLIAYLDSKGIPTIGYGHTRNVHLGDTCSQAQAEAWLLADVAIAQRAVDTCVRVSLTQGEYDALVDFAFNCGITAFHESTMLKLLNEGNYTAAANEFARWDKCDGQEVAGLLRRRVAEKQEFLS